MAKRKPPPYEESQPYKLGLVYKQLGEMLMNERTDLRDLAAAAAYLGTRLTVELVDLDDAAPLKNEENEG